jgi:DNA repair protein RecO
MAYKTYTSEAIVVMSRDRLSADCVVRLFTEEAGMIDARAQSVREEKSKMRYALQPFSRVRITVVRGKREWRLTGVECRGNSFFTAGDRAARGNLVKLMKFINRFVVGEEPHKALYHEVLCGMAHLEQDGSDIAFHVVAFRLLAHLGYMAPEGELYHVWSAPTLQAAITYTLETARHSLEESVAHALTVSHL